MENNCYEKIVRDSLQYVACIDDDFVDPYEALMDSEALDFTKKMYTTIEDTCGCHVEMLRYCKDINPDRVTKCLSNKDLLILDWELLDQHYMPALEILAKARALSMPFVCIYTNIPDVENICGIISSYFSGYSLSEVNDICDKWLDAGVMEADFKTDVLDLFPAEKPNLKRIIARIKEIYGDDVQSLESLNYKNPRSWYPLWLKWSNVTLPNEKLPCAVKVANGTLSIEGMIVCCLSKMASQEKNAVDIADLIPSIAKQITNVPNSIFDVIWLYYSNALRTVLQERTQFFAGIDEKALGYVSKELLSQGECIFNEWMKALFQDEIMDRFDGVNIELPPEVLRDIIEKYGDVQPRDFAEALVALNEKIMVNHIYSKKKHNIDFGDVFVTTEGGEEIYWMCVTAKCECLRPENKIEYNYLFIKGKRMPRAVTALSAAESAYRSFIKNEEELVSIEWKPKLVSVYFKEGDNVAYSVGAKTQGIYKGITLSYTYLCNVKENYAQRMANASFAEGNKVGITLAQI